MSTVPKRQGLRIVLICVLTAIAMKAATEAYKARMRPIWDYHAPISRAALRTSLDALSFAATTVAWSPISQAGVKTQCSSNAWLGLPHHLDRPHYSTSRGASTIRCACSPPNLEGIVSKRKSRLTVQAQLATWLKIKTAAWLAANRDRWEIFDKNRS